MREINAVDVYQAVKQKLAASKSLQTLPVENYPGFAMDCIYIWIGHIQKIIPKKSKLLKLYVLTESEKAEWFTSLLPVILRKTRSAVWRIGHGRASEIKRIYESQ